MPFAARRGVRNQGSACVNQDQNQNQGQSQRKAYALGEGVCAEGACDVWCVV